MNITLDCVAVKFLYITVTYIVDIHNEIPIVCLWIPNRINILPVLPAML